MFTPEQYALAAETAADFNKRQGGELLLVAEPPADLVTAAELHTLATTAPGEYLATNAYMAIKGKRPRHGEVVKLGHLLGHLSVARRRDGPCTLWRLDNAFAQRSH